ncbi:hypothetical protein PsYK624_055450 [Phanerochaete sordida]|uniref:Uncharacterized protein n=1 Tax=Phanerochaete sordida TaxID=48140 RepID=A0A9P3G7V9_9APHY|nr:hypothetical protein PsYK624_055450 [Phanerochaete sordida]
MSNQALFSLRPSTATRPRIATREKIAETLSRRATCSSELVPSGAHSEHHQNQGVERIFPVLHDTTLGDDAWECMMDRSCRSAVTKPAAPPESAMLPLEAVMHASHFPGA